jgi:hypothetical protein
VSFIFDVGETTVWSPALRVGDLYVRFLGQIGDSVGLPTGLSAMASDYYYINPDEFEALITKIFNDNFRSTHQIGRAMLESVLAPSAVILKRIDRPLVARTTEEREFLDRAYELPMAQ